MVQVLQKLGQLNKSTTTSTSKRNAHSSSVAILDAAEHLMSLRGYNSVSMREIAKQAKVSLSSVTHFYGTKENLLAAIYERHTKPMNARRVELLNEAARISNPDEQLSAIVRAYIIPAFSSQTDSGGGAQFTRLRGIMSMEGHDVAKRIIAGSFDEISNIFIDAIHHAVPNSDRVSIIWRAHFLLGSLYYTLVTPERIDRLTGEDGAGSDHTRAVDELVSATVASFKDLAGSAA
ncbi:MAG: TetR family transcriptional regulator [Hyphomicrobiales bacterium]|nr:MAG: TetR family transcriptional regulator [Hyphomicrobiales bacterium]